MNQKKRLTGFLKTYGFGDFRISKGAWGKKKMLGNSGLRRAIFASFIYRRSSRPDSNRYVLSKVADEHVLYVLEELQSRTYRFHGRNLILITHIVTV